MKSTDWQVIKAAKEHKIPDPGFEIDERTAIVITDPQNDFLIADASGSAKLPGLDTFQGSLMNLRMICSHVFTTEEFEEALKTARFK